MTGSPLVTAIMRLIRYVRLQLEPAATSAVSSVPSAITQHPSNPFLIIALAACWPLVVPGSTSTTERAPETSVTTVRAPTSSYLATMRCFGLGRYSAETSPSEVESPMWATARHEVRSGPVGRPEPGTGWVLPTSLDGACTTVLVTGGFTDPAEASEFEVEPTAGACTAPDRPTPAITRIPAAP